MNFDRIEIDLTAQFEKQVGMSTERAEHWAGKMIDYIKSYPNVVRFRITAQIGGGIRTEINPPIIVDIPSYM